MREVLLCILFVLALPQFAAAAGVVGVLAEPLVPGDRAPERAVGSAREPDLALDGAQLHFAQNAPDDAEGAAAPPAQDDISPYESRSDRGLSFGFEITPRSRFGNLARKDDVEDPDLDDQLDRLIERPVFGFRGRYRF
jgi:hypothetical protein